MGKIKNQLIRDLNKLSGTEPAAKMFIDETSIYWVSESGFFLYMADHFGIHDYIDSSHVLVELEDAPEGVGDIGVFWDNLDFNTPFERTHFINGIRQVNV